MRLLAECTSALMTSIDPYLYNGVHVSLIGHDVERIKELGQEVRDPFRLSASLC